ncbi:MAG: FecR domain-containing protein [Betaproteobacteria bacterium]|nr:FecR domain-containing protein [Betaproteobacteria bacterium]
MNISKSRFMQVWLGALLLCVAQLALAQVATVFQMTGTAQAVPGAGAARVLRTGDAVNQGDTVVTGDMSTLVLRFGDGHVAALTGKSRMTISAFEYNRMDPTKSNVLLSLLEGGMRAVTGLIGKANPQKVAYRASNATIGIRGTDATIMTAAGAVSVVVHDGMITFTLPGQQSVSIPAGQGLIKRPDGTVRSAPAAQIIAALRAEAAAAAALANAPGATQAQKDAAAADAAALNAMVSALNTATSSSIVDAVTKAAAAAAAPPTPPAPPKPPVPPVTGKGASPS